MWLDLEMEHPDRHDYYLMALTSKVHYLLSSKTPASARLEDFRLKFTRQRDRLAGQTDAEQDQAHKEHLANVSAIAKATALARVGGKVNRIEVRKETASSGN